MKNLIISEYTIYYGTRFKLLDFYITFYYLIRDIDL